MKDSQWGAIQFEKTVGPGIRQVETAAHGGYLLDDDAINRMPDELRAIQPWAGHGAYEEDCDWVIVVLAFPQYFTDQEVLNAVIFTMSDLGDERVRRALLHRAH
jgi:hypothetical protein